MTIESKPIIVLVHGAWHGAWCWKYQVPELTALGYEVETLDLPSVTGDAGMTQFHDVAHVSSKIQSLTVQDKRVVVVGHSYGGSVVNGAVNSLSERRRRSQGVEGGVVGVIVLAGFVLPGGLDQQKFTRDIGGPPWVLWETPKPGFTTTKESAERFYAPDTPAERTEWALQQLRPSSTAAFTGIVPAQAWQDDATNYAGRLGYILTGADGALLPEVQQAMIAGAGGEERWMVRTLPDSSHSPFLSRPKELADMIDELVTKFEKTS